MYIYMNILCIYIYILIPQVYVNPLGKSRISQVSGKRSGWDGQILWSVSVERFVKRVQNLSWQTDLHLSRTNSSWTFFLNSNLIQLQCCNSGRVTVKQKQLITIYIYICTHKYGHPAMNHIYIYTFLMSVSFNSGWYYFIIDICVCVWVILYELCRELKV